MGFRINRVYTRSGDDGETALVGGRRVLKSDLRVSAYGDIDELNSVLGCVKEELDQNTSELRPLIEQLQQELFDLGSELATDDADRYEGMWSTRPDHVTRLEELCDRFGEGLPELKSFILPGGSRVASFLHLARTVARRAERGIVSLQRGQAAKGTFNSEIVRYVNRLSDLLFVLARWSLVKEGKDAPLWVQEKERGGG